MTDTDTEEQKVAVVSIEAYVVDSGRRLKTVVNLEHRLLEELALTTSDGMVILVREIKRALNLLSYALADEILAARKEVDDG